MFGTVPNHDLPSARIHSVLTTTHATHATHFDPQQHLRLTADYKQPVTGYAIINAFIMDPESTMPVMATRKAQPVLASALIEDAVLDDIVDAGLSSTSHSGHGGAERDRRGRNRIRVGLKSIDDALDGGLELGSVVAVSGEVGGGGGGAEVSSCCHVLIWGFWFRYLSS